MQAVQNSSSSGVRQWFDRHVRHMVTPWIILVVSLGPSLMVWWHVRQAIAAAQEQRFSDELNGLKDVFHFYFNQRFEEVREIAGSLRRGWEVTPENWRQFIQRVGWRQRIAGMQDMGYAEMARDPAGQISFPIKYLDSRLTNAFHQIGVDLAKDPDRWQAMTNALARHGSVSTIPLNFYGTNQACTNYDVVVFMPADARRTNASPASRDTPVSTGLLFFSIDQRRRFNAMKVSLGNRPIVVELLAPNSNLVAQETLERVIALETAGGAWKFRITADPSFHRNADWALPRLVLCGGISMSVLLFGLSWTQGRRRQEVEHANAKLRQRDIEIQSLNQALERRIAQRTTELSDANSHLARFKVVSEATSDLVAMATLEGQILFLNQAGRRLVGLKLEEDITHLKVPDFYPDWVNKLFAEEAIPLAMREGSWSGEVAVRHRDGHEIPVSMVGLIIKSPSGQPEYMSCIIRDISERRLHEEGLQKALNQEKELNRMKTSFVSLVSHEFRTPLGIIMSSAQILEAYFDRLSPERRLQQVHAIRDSVKRMGALMEDVLLLGRFEAGSMTCKPALLNLENFCRELTDEILSATSHRCPVECALTPPYPRAMADETLLRHILTNLLSNAIKYSPPGSTVHWSLQRAGTEAVFTVSDHGRGIPAGDLPHLFEPFRRASNVDDLPGTGLGLALVKHCVALQGGKIAVESQANSGTTFTITLSLFAIPD